MMMKVFSPLPTVMDEGRYAVTKNEAEKYMFKKEINMGDPIGLFSSAACYARIEMTIRQETKEDINEVYVLHEVAFGQPQEANIVDKLRNNCEGLLSLVATENGKIVGHILFSPAEIEGPFGAIKGVGLASMAVLPSMQRHGIETQLINKGIEIEKN